MDAEHVHATCVAIRHEPGWSAVLLRGPSGAGKSSLALRLIDAGWRLVSDDQTVLRRTREAIVASPPPRLAGLLEVRGLGIVRLAGLAEAPVRLVVDLVPADQLERLPRPGECDLLGAAVARLALAPDDPLGPAKLKLLLDGVAMLDPDAALAEPGGMSVARHGDAPYRESMGQTSKAAENQRAGETARRPVVLITGLSGAGLSLALSTLEDLGYEAMSNLPLELIGQAVDQMGTQGGQAPDPAAAAAADPIALEIDSRTRDFAVVPLLTLYQQLKRAGRFAVTLLYLHCDDEVLVRRFTETRRRHPLALDRPLSDGIVAERRMISRLRASADLVIDTSALLPADFRRVLADHFTLEGGRRMTIVVTSFSYKRGLPRAADLVFDVRFLTNPHYRDELRPLTGQDPAVVAFIEADADFSPFFASLEAMLLPLLPRYEREGKAYLTIALGCTGGRHRSVAVAGRLSERLKAQGRQVTLVHRDLQPAPDQA